MNETTTLVEKMEEDAVKGNDRSALPAPKLNIMTWEADDDDQGPVCDLETGLCTDPDGKIIS